MATKIPAPQRQSRIGGIKSVVDFANPAAARLSIDEGLVWEDSSCGFPNLTRAGCYDDVVEAAAKEFGGVSQYAAIGPVFAQYAGVECWLGGDSDQTYLDQAKQKLEAGEDREVEFRLWEWAEAATDTEAATDVTAALAAAEQHADELYVGAPLILASRATVVQLKAAGALEIREDGTIHTPNGNRLIASSQFGDGVAAVGWPAVLASTIVAATAVNHTENIDAALAERLYAIAVDCDYRFIATV